MTESESETDPVPRPRQIEYCEHCVSAEENAVLLRIAPGELTARQLGRYAFKALSTWGGPADLRYFTPRLLELLVTGELSVYTMPQSLIRKVTECWAGWSAAEREAIRVVLRAWWLDTLARYPAPDSAHTVFAALSNLGEDPVSYLSAFSQIGSEAGALHLADLIADWRATSGGEWDRGVEHWMAGPIPAGILEAATLDATTDSVAARLSEAYESISVRAWPGR